jgi:hypothetical protein
VGSGTASRVGSSAASQERAPAADRNGGSATAGPSGAATAAAAIARVSRWRSSRSRAAAGLRVVRGRGAQRGGHDDPAADRVDQPVGGQPRHRRAGDRPGHAGQRRHRAQRRRRPGVDTEQAQQAAGLFAGAGAARWCTRGRVRTDHLPIHHRTEQRERAAIRRAGRRHSESILTRN